MHYKKEIALTHTAKLVNVEGDKCTLAPQLLNSGAPTPTSTIAVLIIRFVFFVITLLLFITFYPIECLKYKHELLLINKAFQGFYKHETHASQDMWIYLVLRVLLVVSWI